MGTKSKRPLNLAQSQQKASKQFTRSKVMDTIGLRRTAAIPNPKEKQQPPPSSEQTPLPNFFEGFFCNSPAHQPIQAPVCLPFNLQANVQQPFIYLSPPPELPLYLEPKLPFEKYESRILIEPKTMVRNKSRSRGEQLHIFKPLDHQRVRMRRNNYVVYDRLLGSGTFSKVYLGRDEHTGEEVAVKQISDWIDSQIEVMNITNSKFIIKMLNYWRIGRTHYIVLEKCSGTLKDIVQKLSLEKAVYLFRQILEGIQHLHLRSIIHRDIKLENILIKDNKVKISDFGLAKQMGNKLQVESMKCGTPCTMAPEIYFTDNTNVCHKKPLYNNKCDIWSIGVVLHELAYKKHPFGYDFELFRKNQRINLDNPIPAIERIIDRCLVMDSKDRADISELVKMASEYPFEPSKLVEKSSDTLGILENPTIGRLSPKYRPALKIEDSVQPVLVFKKKVKSNQPIAPAAIDKPLLPGAISDITINKAVSPKITDIPKEQKETPTNLIEVEKPHRFRRPKEARAQHQRPISSGKTWRDYKEFLAVFMLLTIFVMIMFSGN